ncbi:O-methyltransferase [Sutcliffiella rhizosphaerae]|uniref:tRNA 5-hydroxyuridine methyltransferase n=1 Tax=Sutcliffiella rhizosphaerae TaxID=2880967 RepID=A0ABN8A2Q1_9BACI|nr:O-methyltransferase [Sutcliffiella rhizosphaerae]CAG9619423.1 tRNA 5-hydroxyuridine methyltransferase [Sutcliffiella rhizosphaerae]
MEANNDKVISYLESLIPKRNNLVTQMEHEAREDNVPIMDLVGMETLLQLLRLEQPKCILEIGTAIGYSAIRMAEALPSTTIVTIERDEQRYLEAKKNIGLAKLENRIHLIFGDALEVFDEVKMKASYDLIFVDAAKGQYERFFSMYETLLSTQGTIISDNVLFRGLVADNYEAIEPKRIRNLVKKIDRYNRWLTEHPSYITTILPVGDGIAISKRRGEKGE